MLLNLVGNMGNHLHGAAKIIAAPLFLDDTLVDLAGREVIALGHLRGDEALVMAKIEIGFSTIVGSNTMS